MSAKHEGEKMVCPHCGYKYDEPVSDFVVPTNFTKDPTVCDECRKTFYTQQDQLDHHYFKVTKA